MLAKLVFPFLLPLCCYGGKSVHVIAFNALHLYLTTHIGQRKAGVFPQTLKQNWQQKGHQIEKL